MNQKRLLAVFFAALVGCSSNNPKPAEGEGGNAGGGAAATPETPKADDGAKKAAQCFDDAQQAEKAGQYVKARDLYLQAQAQARSWKEAEVSKALANLEEVISI